MNAAISLIPFTEFLSLIYLLDGFLLEPYLGSVRFNPLALTAPLPGNSFGLRPGKAEVKFEAVGDFHDLFFDESGKVELNFRERPSAIKVLVKLSRGHRAIQLSHLCDDRRLCLLDVGPGVDAQVTPGPIHPSARSALGQI
jgi:hypothetical protein